MVSLLNFRKAMLPIEAEMNDNSAGDDGSHQFEDSEEREQICSQMKKIKEVIDYKAMENIEDAQDRYKRDYDKKHHTSSVCLELHSYIYAYLFVIIFVT